MANVEISEENFQVLQNAHALLNKMWNGDKSMDFKRMVKEVMPESQIPELDTVDRITKPLDEKVSAADKRSQALEDRLNKMEEDRKNRDEESALKKDIESVQSKYKFTDDGMKKVFDRMRAKSNPDVESAAAWVKAQEPEPKPSSSSTTPYSAPGKLDLYGSSNKSDDWAELNKDPMGFFDKTVEQILNTPVDQLDAA